MIIKKYRGFEIDSYISGGAMFLTINHRERADSYQNDRGIGMCFSGAVQYGQVYGKLEKPDYAEWKKVGNGDKIGWKNFAMSFYKKWKKDIDKEIDRIVAKYPDRFKG